MADTPDLGSGAVRREGSSPFSRRAAFRPRYCFDCMARSHCSGHIDTFKDFWVVLKMRGNSSVVERDLAKVDVAGPTPVSRSNDVAIRLQSGSPFLLLKRLRIQSIYCY